jgi:dTDP-4-dehydrorhamnose 3,5-epimerase
MFEFQELPLAGAFIIQGKLHADERGIFRKTVHTQTFSDRGLRSDFVEQYYTVSRKNVLRGMHFQSPPFDHAKLVYCVKGIALDVLVDLRQGSKTYGQSTAIEISSDNARAVYASSGFAHGFLALEDDTTMMYSVTSSHAPTADHGIRWDSFGFNWPVNNPILSERDCAFPTLGDFSTPFKEIHHG